MQSRCRRALHEICPEQRARADWQHGIQNICKSQKSLPNHTKATLRIMKNTEKLYQATSKPCPSRNQNIFKSYSNHIQSVPKSLKPQPDDKNTEPRSWKTNGNHTKSMPRAYPIHENIKSTKQKPCPNHTYQKHDHSIPQPYPNHEHFQPSHTPPKNHQKHVLCMIFVCVVHGLFMVVAWFVVFAWFR